MSFLRIFAKPVLRPLGRWGVSHEKALSLMESNKIYDSSFTPYHVDSERLNCIFKKMDSVKMYYCMSCFRLRNESEIIEKKDRSYIVEDPSYCLHRKD